MDLISKKDGIDKKTIKEYFKAFHENLPANIEKAKQLLQKQQLDFSIEEIDMMGLFYRDNYRHPEKHALTYDQFLDVFIVYCCEAWIHHFGGEYFDTVSKKDTAYGYPQLINWGPENYTWIGIAPHDWAEMIEEGDEEPLSLPWSRNIRYFSNSAEWNYKLKK
ncbi:MAG: hypothetical protein JNM88_04215 [Chitinophagaceae bacterium]|nr:hypothetical protein [Chitinophagaceae bacterium]